MLSVILLLFASQACCLVRGLVRAMEAGGRELAWLAMQAHPDHEELQRRGQCVLDCLLDPPAPPADRGEGPV